MTGCFVLYIIYYLCTPIPQCATVMKNKFDSFLSDAQKIVGRNNVYTDSLRRFAWGTDAGFYRLVPKIVIRSKSEREVSALLESASRYSVPITFRAAGTSLSGQSISDSVLIIAGKNWEDYSISSDASSIRLQPGVVGAEVNELLAPFKRKFGPDPASIKSCMVGGIVMNNASGMSCGAAFNSDRMLQSARIVFADGSMLDTSSELSRIEFIDSHPELISEITQIRDEINSDEAMVERIRSKYSIKNVTGLNLLPFIEFNDPIDIILHSLVGSEGTLAFVSEVTMRTLPLIPLHADAMVYFNDMAEASRAVIALKPLNVSAVEMLDKRSLASVNAGDVPGLTALLIRTEAADQHSLTDNVRSIIDVLSTFNTYSSVRFTDDPEECSEYWKIRSGIFPTVGGMRKPGTTCLIEDVAFHVEDLPEAVKALSDILERNGYDDSCIYGHALEGNFHFIINQSFSSQEEVMRYKAMINEVADLVVKRFDGSLKAEHGTGRNMAPYVEYEWGHKAFSYMKRIKKAFDPDNILNPGVIFNDDPECCFKNFKALPLLAPSEGASEEMRKSFDKINKCIECGFCEINCVSCGFTLSSRTRIAVQRQIADLERSGEDPRLLNDLKKQYSYYGEQTCAADGLCSMSCPMNVNVADLTHEVRRQSMPQAGKYVGKFAASHFKGIKSGLRTVLKVAHLGHRVLGSTCMNAVGKALHSVGLPEWTPAIPRAYDVSRKLKPAVVSDQKVVYFPSCINQMMGLEKDAEVTRTQSEVMVELLEKAGWQVVFPENMDALCCGTIWDSKGLPEIAERKLRELENALWTASDKGRYPVVCDQSPCLHRMKHNMTKVDLYESAEFIWKFLRDRLVFTRTDDPVALHLTCSTRLMGIDRIVYDLACLCSSDVLIPEGVGCCGFAGDKGMTHPELNAYALRKLRAQIESKGIKVGYSNSRTCEMGLRTNAGIPYRSIIYLVNASTKAKS